MPSKKVLIAGLGRFIKADPQGEAHFGPRQNNVQILQENMARAKEAGYEPSNIDLDPQNVADSLVRWEAELKKEKWDLVVIGYGIRGNKDFTELFEKAVNAAVAIQPGIKFGFSVSPAGVFECMKRVLENQ